MGAILRRMLAEMAQPEAAVEEQAAAVEQRLPIRMAALESSLVVITQAEMVRVAPAAVVYREQALPIPVLMQEMVEQDQLI